MMTYLLGNHCFTKALASAKSNDDSDACEHFIVKASKINLLLIKELTV